MNAHTPVCDLLGIDHPIVEAPLSADPRLPAAVSNAGGLGTLGLGWADDAGAVVTDTAALTDRPFAGNFVLAFDQALSAGLRIVSLFWGDPHSYVDSVHDAGGLVMHTVGSVEEARHAVGCGVDVVVAQGWEAGGHVWSGVATLPLVPAVVDAVAPVPVIAAGGIGDARGVAAVLALGAQAALLGTRFLLADEMPIHEEYRRRLIAATETDAEWYSNLYAVGWPDTSHRAIHNSTPRCGRPRAGRHSGAGRKRAKSWRTSPPARRSFDTNPRPRWLGPQVRSNRCPYGPGKASRSPNNHSPPRKSWPNSSRACSAHPGSPPHGSSSHDGSVMSSATNVPQARLNRLSSSQSRVVLDNPPLNLMGSEFVLQIREIVTALENDDRVKVVVFESAVDGFFLNHSDFREKLKDLTRIPARA